MDEDHKGCLIVGGCSLIVVLGAMIALCVALSAMLKSPSVPIQPVTEGFDRQVDAVNSFLILIIELVRYLMTPFVPMLRVLG